MITRLVTHMLENVRDSGQTPTLVEVSPDIYALWEKQHGGEPCTVNGVSIRIKDNLKPNTILVLGDLDHSNPSHGDYHEYRSQDEK